MNEKGFAATSILYTILVVFILIMFSMISLFYSRNNILNRIQDDIEGNIYKEVVLNINGQKYTHEVSNIVEFDITGIDVDNMTHIVCNNGAEVTLEDNKIIVSKVLGGTVCNMNTSLLDTVNNLDDSLNYILMLKDETLSEALTINQYQSLKLNTNSQNLISSGTNYVFDLYGSLSIYGNGSVIGNDGNSIIERDGANLIIDGGTYSYVRLYGGVADIKNSTHKCTTDKTNCYPIYISGNSNLKIDNIQVTSLGKSLGVTGSAIATVANSTFNCTNDNCVWFNSSGNLLLDKITIISKGYGVRNTGTNSGIIEIKNSIIESNGHAIQMDDTTTGIVNIYNSNIKTESVTKDADGVYVGKHVIIISNGGGTVNVHNSELSSKYGSTVGMSSTGVENSIITLNNSTLLASTALAVFNEGAGTININGGTLNGALASVSNRSVGTININGGQFNVVGTGSLGAIVNGNAGTINICSGTVNGLPTLYDLYNSSAGYIYYKSGVTLANNKIYDPNSHVILNNNLTC